MNLSDPELELVDPTPNVHTLFLHFDQLFFWTKLASRAVVRWSKRMYSCAGICSYDRGGLCDIALSEPLLKLRPRKDLVETLLHEMIHAFLFVTNRDQDRDGHGPNFKQHMHRINKAAGLNISIYHNFYEEVNLYRTHVWRCNGPCHTMKPHFGIVRRPMNRTPGPTDYWWKDHQRKCGGTFIKIQEPENYGKNKSKRVPPKPSEDITKYITNTTTTTNNNTDKVTKPVLKDSNIPVKPNLIIKSKSSGAIVVTKRNNVIYNPQVVKSPVVYSGKGHVISPNNSKKSMDVAETVRNVWANKQLTPIIIAKSDSKNNMLSKNSVSSITGKKSTKTKADSQIFSPPNKIKKIDDYFKNSATSILKDLYGKDFQIKENSNNNNKRLSVVAIENNLVDCPVCSNKVRSEEINRHIDECLNKEAIESIIDNKVDTKAVINIMSETNKLNYDDPILDVNENKSGERIKPNFKPININADECIKTEDQNIKLEPGTSKSSDILITINEQKCPCCGNIVSKSLDEHLDECLAFFNDNSTMPAEGASTSFVSDTVVIDDDDDLDETLTMNETGTKYPCPCCLKMIEQNDMNDHLDVCLN